MNENIKQESLADVIAEGRGYKGIPVPYAPARAIWLDEFNSFLDRIEAAYKRDIEKLNSVIQATVSRSDAEIDRLRREVAELRKQIGNAAKLREALDAALVLLEERQKLALCRNGFVQIKTKYCDLKDAIEKCRSVLSAPPRNCDIYQDGQSAYNGWRDSFRDKRSPELMFSDWIFETAKEKTDGSK